MRARTPLVVATALALAAALPAHAKGAPTLDGKKTKTLSWTGSSTPQDHDSDFVSESTGDGPDFSQCKAPECLVYTFVYRPARHVKAGAFSVRAAWTLPGEDFDLYVADNNAVVGTCGAGAGTSEVVVITNPIPRHTYKVIVHEFRTATDTVKTTVSFPAKDKIATTAPAKAESVEAVNCGIS